MTSYLVMDGFWGSCGKGLIAGKLAIDRNPDVAVCNFGPNAGHTYVDENGPVVTRQLPTAVINKKVKLMVGPGAIIDPIVLLAELEELKRFDPASRLVIHPRAAIVNPYDKEIEAQTMGGIASTKKGVGEALRNKIARQSCPERPVVAYQCKDVWDWVVEMDEYYNALHDAKLVQIESAQGFGLSINHGTSYPMCTSRDIAPESILNDVGISYRTLGEVVLVLRTFPIRVGHELDSQGNVIGHSGPHYDDQKELTWAEMSEIAGTPLIEQTTVTKKVRRVFTFSNIQLENTLKFVAPCSIFMNFMNYIPGENRRWFLSNIEQITKNHSSIIKWLGYGPKYSDVVNYPNLQGYLKLE